MSAIPRCPLCTVKSLGIRTCDCGNCKNCSVEIGYSGDTYCLQCAIKLNKCFCCGNEYKPCREYIEPAVAILTTGMTQYDGYIITETNITETNEKKIYDLNDFWYSNEMQESMKAAKQNYVKMIDSFIKLFNKEDSSIEIISTTCDQWLNSFN